MATCGKTGYAPSYAYKKGCRCDDCQRWRRTSRNKESEANRQRSKRWRRENPERSRARARRWKEENPEKVLSAYLRRYDLSIGEYNATLEMQKGVCAICHRQSGSKRLAIDHDHKTGKFRALLCAECNTGLGKFQDNPEFLRNAATYLEGA